MCDPLHLPMIINSFQLAEKDCQSRNLLKVLLAYYIAIYKSIMIDWLFFVGDELVQVSVKSKKTYKIIRSLKWNSFEETVQK